MVRNRVARRRERGAGEMTASVRSLRVRQTDVARASGVSRATVSRILNNCTTGFSVTPEVRARVLDAASKLGYKPDLAARALRRRKPDGLIGWLGWTYPEGFSESFLRTLSAELPKHGLVLSPTFLPPETDAFSVLPWWRIDAAIVTDVTLGDPVIDALEREGIPYITVNCERGESGVAVRMDDEGGMRQVCRHLLALGHRRIAYVERKASAMRSHASVALRRRGFEDSMADAGLEPVRRAGGQPWVADERGELVRGAVLEGGATALILYSASAALFAYDALLCAGLRVPEDVSLVSCHDAYPLQHLGKGITAVVLNAAEAARASAEIAAQIISSPGERHMDRLLPERLELRGSTAPPR